MWGWFASGEPSEGLLPELPSPQSDEDFRNIVQQKMSNLFAVVASPKWTPMDFNENGTPSDIKLWDLTTENESIGSVKTEVTLPVNPITIFKLVQSIDITEVKLFDKDLFSVTLLKEFKDSLQCQIVQTVYTAPFPVANREFIILRGGKKEEDGTYLSLNCSINFKGAHEIPGHVRGVCAIAGWIIKPLEGGTKCQCIRVAQVDPKGWIPPMVVNLFKWKAAEGLVDIKKMVAEGKLK